MLGAVRSARPVGGRMFCPLVHACAKHTGPARDRCCAAAGARAGLARRDCCAPGTEQARKALSRAKCLVEAGPLQTGHNGGLSRDIINVIMF